MRKLSGPVAVAVAWVAVLVLYEAAAVAGGWPFHFQSFGMGTLGLSSSALSLLLVFRTNSSYQRFVEARQICARPPAAPTGRLFWQSADVEIAAAQGAAS